MKLPYGYVVDGEKIVIHEERADAIRSIFEYYLAGASLGKIVDMLYAKGIPSLTGKPIHRIVKYIVVPEQFPVLDDQFLKQLSSDYRDSILQAGGKCFIPDECVIYDLFHGALHLFQNHLLKNTADGEALILYQQKLSDAKDEARHQDANRHMEDDISGQLQQLLRCQGKTNPKTIKSAYHLLSDAI